MDKFQRKIRRSPSLKRRSKVVPIGQRLTLERVLGLTVSSNAAFTCDPVSGVIAYPAGCVVVLFNPRRNRQSHIFNVSKKTITSVAFSADGKHLVTGECGHQPAVRVWDVEEKTQVAEFHGHKFGINCVAFSPNLKYIVSIGSQHDMVVNVWNWRTGNKIASNKVSCKVSSVAFGSDSSFFVTVGNRHVKFWYLDSSQSKINQTVPLLGHSGILGEHKNNYFCDVACGRGKTSGSTFVITQSGLLCAFDDKRVLDKWVDLKAKNANCIIAGEEHIYIGCAEGVVRVFSADSFQFVANLPYPHHLGVDVANATSSSDLICTETDAKYPGVIAITLDDRRKKVACVYNDHSLYVWDVMNLQRVGKAWSFLFHSGCVWALEVYPRLENGQTGALPPGSFVTASTDNTIRVWNLDPRVSQTPGYKHNVYSTELLKVVYTDPTHSFLCDVDYNPAGGTDKTDTTWDEKNGVRSIRISPDGQHLASGDRQGNIRIYDLHQMSEIRLIEAHESDVVCLEYLFSKAGPKILASGGRDRLIHVFDVEQHYGLVQTLDDHSATIQSVRFTDASNRLRMLSCGSDKSLLFRNATSETGFEFSLDQHLVSKSTMYDMIIDPTHKFVATACQDRNIRIYNMKTAKQRKNYRASLGDDGTLLRVQLDPSGTYAATSCTDKNVCVLDFYTGELTATVYGHSEIITGLHFTNDLKHLISVSADGCIFVWRVSSDMTKTMRVRMEQLGKMPKEEAAVLDTSREARLVPSPMLLDSTYITSSSAFPVIKESISPSSVLSTMDLHLSSGSQHPFSYPETPVRKRVDSSSPQPSPAHQQLFVGPLPSWAKAKLDDTCDGADHSLDTAQPKGRWAQRFDQNLAFKSQLDLSQIEEGDIDSRRLTGLEGGGLQNGMLTSSMPDLRRETVVLPHQHLPAKNIPIIDDDDETNVDEDEDFFPAYMKDKLPENENECSSSEVDSRRRTQNGDSLGGRSDRVGFRRFSNQTSIDGEDMTQSTDFEDLEDSDVLPDATRIIYPPSKPDVVDPCNSTYQVFAADEVKKRTRRRTSSTHTEEGDEPVHCVSVEENTDIHDEATVASSSGSQSKSDCPVLPHTSDKEQFMKENFESVSFTPVAMDKFVQQVASLEQAVDVSSEQTGLPFSPRLSLSSRFLSRSHFVGVRSGARLGTRRNVDNHLNPVPKSQSVLAHSMEDTRRRLASVNWRTGGLIQESPEKDDPHSPPTKLENKEPSFSTPVSSSHGNLGEKLEKENSPIHSVPARNAPCATHRAASKPSHKTAPASGKGKRLSTDGTHSHGTKGPRSSSVPPSPRQAPSYCRTTQSSRLKSSSASNLLKQVENQHGTTASAAVSGEKMKGVGKTRKGRLLPSGQGRHKSTPNLISCSEMEKNAAKQVVEDISSSNLCGLANLSFSDSDILSVENATSVDSMATSVSTLTCRDQKIALKNLHAKGNLRRGKSLPSENTTSQKHTHGQDHAVTDTVLMPPPPGTSSTQQSLLQRAAQAYKGSASSLTLEQAKSILLGNSGILEVPQISADGVSATFDGTSAPVSDRIEETQNGTSSLVLYKRSETLSSTSTTRSSPASLHNVSPPSLVSSSPKVYNTTTVSDQDSACVSCTTEIVHTGSRHSLDRNLVSYVDVTRFDIPEHDKPKSQKAQSCAVSLDSLFHDRPTPDTDDGISDVFDAGQETMSMLDEMAQLNNSLQRDSLGVGVGSAHAEACHDSCRMFGSGHRDSALLTEQMLLELNTPSIHLPSDYFESSCYRPSLPGHTLSPIGQGLLSCAQSPQGKTVSLCSRISPGQMGSSCSQSPQEQTLLSNSPSPREQITCGQSPQGNTSSSCSQSPEQNVSPRSQSDTGLGSDTDTDCDTLHSPLNQQVDEEKMSSPLAVNRNQELMTKCSSIVDELKTAVQRTKDFCSEMNQRKVDDPSHQQMMNRLSDAIHQAHLTVAELALHTTTHTSVQPRFCPLTGETGGGVEWDSAVVEQARSMLRPFMWSLSRELSQEVVKVVQKQLEEGSTR